MIHAKYLGSALALVGVLPACAGTDIDAREDARADVRAEAVEALALEAAGGCDETIPDNRQIDGVPAFAQCASTANSAIYSNNGVDTSTTKLGADWVRTQWSGGYQCTELAHRYLLFRWKISWLPNGNAGAWCDRQPPASSGVVQTRTPVHGDLMVLAGGSCGAGVSTGHVNVVDVVDAARSRVTVVEQNMARRGSYAISCAKCFLHVVENDGVPRSLDDLRAAED